MICSHSYQRLQLLLQELAPVAVAFSGGVDSSLLLKVAADTLGADCCAVTVDTPFHFRQELADAAALARQLQVPHLFLTLDPDDLPGLLDNPPDRCYRCKRTLLSLCLTSLVSCSLAPGPWTLIDGSTLDDQTAHRPGRRALQELGVRSPLAEAGLDKVQIRSVSRALGLPTWDKPAQSCLLTRFPYHQTISRAELTRVETSEIAIQQLGFSVVRVRSLGNLARIETNNGERAHALLPEIEAACRVAGFEQTELDPGDYRSGSMDQN